MLAALQTLCYDKLCIKGVLKCSGIITALFEHAQSGDQEVSILALATLVNILVYVDTAVLLSAEQGLVDDVTRGMEVLIDIVKSSQDKPQRFYAAAGIANASAHPIFKNALKDGGGNCYSRIFSMVLDCMEFLNVVVFGQYTMIVCVLLYHLWCELYCSNGTNASYRTTKLCEFACPGK